MEKKKLIYITLVLSAFIIVAYYGFIFGSTYKISKAVLTLRFYDILDDHAGDLTKAHWVSEPIIKEEVRF